MVQTMIEWSTTSCFSFVFYHVADFFACVHLIIVFNGMHNMACPWGRNVLFLFDLKNFVYC